jgi:hypothetical protein
MPLTMKRRKPTVWQRIAMFSAAFWIVAGLAGWHGLRSEPPTDNWRRGVFGMGMAALSIYWMFRVSPAPDPIPGKCPKCGYDLSGNVSGICPECGTRVG